MKFRSIGAEPKTYQLNWNPSMIWHGREKTELKGSDFEKSKKISPEVMTCNTKNPLDHFFPYFLTYPNQRKNIDFMQH
jgi:hypothetical protein